MKHVIHWLGLLTFIPAFLAAQEVEVKREREFTGSGLYGFMNGGAEPLNSWKDCLLIRAKLNSSGGLSAYPGSALR